MGRAGEPEGLIKRVARPGAGESEEEEEDDRWTGAGPVAKPGKFNGDQDLENYLGHFELCVRANGWSKVEAGVFLGLSLEGGALRQLKGINLALPGGYGRLKKALIRRYEPTNQEETYKALLNARERKPGESLQALEEELSKFTRLAYPDADAKTIDSLVLDRFLSSLRDPQLRQWVYQSTASQPAMDLQMAIQTAVTAEAFLKTDADKRQRLRAADASVAEQLKTHNDQMKQNGDQMRKMAEIIEKLTKQAESPAAGERRKNWNRPSWLHSVLRLRTGGAFQEGVSQPGQQRNTAASGRDGSGSIDRKFGKLETTSTGSTVEVKDSRAEKAVQGRREKGGGGLIVPGVLDGHEIQLLVDTGASINLISLSWWTSKGKPGAWAEATEEIYTVEGRVMAIQGAIEAQGGTRRPAGGIPIRYSRCGE